MGLCSRVLPSRTLSFLTRLLSVKVLLWGGGGKAGQATRSGEAPAVRAIDAFA